MVTVPLKLVAVLPNASCAATRTAGVIAAPAAVLVGCTVTLSRVAVLATIAKLALVSGVSPVADAASL